MPWYLTLWRLRHMDTFFPSNEILPEHSQCIRICGTKSLHRFEVLGRNAWNCSHAGSRKLVHENTCQRWFYARQALYIYHEYITIYNCMFIINCISNNNQTFIQVHFVNIWLVDDCFSWVFDKASCTCWSHSSWEGTGLFWGSVVT